MAEETGKLNFVTEWESNGKLDFTAGIAVEPPKWSANGDLNFVTEWSANGTLDFVVGDGVAPPTIIDIVAVNYLLPPVSLGSFSPTVDVVGDSYVIAPLSNGYFLPSIAITGESVAVAPTASGTITRIDDFVANTIADKPTSNASFNFDINVFSGFRHDIATVEGDASRVDEQKSSLFNDSPKQHNSNVVSIFDGDYLADSIVAPQLEFDRAHNENVVTIFDGDYISNSVEHKLIGIVDADLGFNSLFTDGERTSRDLSSLYKYPPRADCEKSALWLDASKHRREWLSQFLSGLPIKKEWFSYYEDAIDPTGTRPIIIDPPIEPPITEREGLNFRKLWDNLGELDFLYIELDALIIMNTVIMYHTSKLGERTYINPVSWSVSNDLDSFAWTLNCSLYDNGILDLIATDDTFTLEVNDVKWNFNAFKYKRLQDGQFSGYSVTFVSQTQQLGYPLAQPVNVSLDAPKGAIQLIDETLGDIPLINKGVNEWTLQADTIEMMQAEPKAIISEILKASGAVMLPSVSGESIMIQPRYKVASWLMNELTDEECDVLLDGNYMVTDSGEIRNGVEYNAVTISGEKSGVVTKIVRDGTGGETEATDYTTQFHQDHNVGLEYAKKVFSESGTIELAEISVGLDENLLQSGSIVRIKHASGDRTGVSLGVSVKGDRVENVLQTATIEFRI